MSGILDGTKRLRITNTMKFWVGLILAMVMMFPIYTTIMGGFKHKGELFVNPFGLPVPFRITAYVDILLESNMFWILLKNSTLIVAGVLAIVICCSMMTAFAISRIKFHGRTLIYNFFLMGMLFPLTVAILPLYLQLKSLGLLGTRGGVILAEAAFNFPLSIFIFTGFFHEIPRDLQDACEIDGGGLFTFFIKVVIPLSRPVISTVAVIVFIQSWNQFLFPLLVLDDWNMFTIPLGVMQYQGQFATGWNYIMAFITISILPMAIFYYALQKHIVAGLTAGAIKG